MKKHDIVRILWYDGSVVDEPFDSNSGRKNQDEKIYFHMPCGGDLLLRAARAGGLYYHYPFPDGQDLPGGGNGGV